MGKKKYNYQVGDTFMERVEGFFTHKLNGFIVYHIIAIDSKPIEKYTLLSIHITLDGKFKNCFRKILRASLNNHIRHSIRFQEFIDSHKLEFLVLTGKTVYEVITEALERHEKHQNRYILNVNPEQITINTEEI